MSTSFGELLKNLRIARRLTLRQCAVEIGWDASNWSKMERGVNPAPKDEVQTGHMADFFELKDKTRGEFLDLASISRREIPRDMASDATVIAALPVFFRAVRGKELTEESLKSFMEDLRRVESPDPE